MTNKKFSQVCRQAAKVIQRDGLLKGMVGSNDGPKCALGALRYVVRGTTDQELGVPWSFLNGVFRHARPRSQRDGIIEFNDAPRTRKHDVVELLRDMAVAARTW